MNTLEKVDKKAAEIAAQFADLRETLAADPEFFGEFRANVQCHGNAEISFHLTEDQRHLAPAICQRFALVQIKRKVSHYPPPSIWWAGFTATGAEVTIFNAEAIPADELVDLSKFEGGGA